MSPQTQTISSLDDPRIADYRDVRDADLLGERGLFMAEGRFIVAQLASGRSLYRPRSYLLTHQAFEALENAINLDDPDAPPVYVAEQGVMDAITGFHIHRGALSAGERSTPPDVGALLRSVPDGPATIVLLEGLSNHDNLGGIFRNALAFGAAGIILSPGCCDPLYRKAIRVSMGAALRVPFAVSERWTRDLALVRGAGFRLIALATGPDSEPIERVVRSIDAGERVAILLGAEGPGLTPEALQLADRVVRIPMAPTVDSLNVATTAGIALHLLARPGVQE